MENSENTTGHQANGDSGREETDAFGFSLRKLVPGGNKKGKRAKNNDPRPEAKMVVPHNSLFYKMDHKVRGKAIIFNHEFFDMPKLGDRSGTNADRDNLKRTFTRLGFEVKIHENLSAKQVLSLVDSYSKEDYSESDCLVMCVLSHGEENGIIFAKDTGFSTEHFWTPFTADKAPTLAGKPKLFFFQACQGSKLDPGVKMTQRDSAPSYRLPLYADFLICYSTVPGFYSWRNVTKGSWFIQALCAELDENGDNFDLVTMMTFVNRRVAIDFQSYVPNNKEMHEQKQIPSIHLMLTRLVKFTRKA